MKKTFLKLSFYSFILFSVVSCGSSSEDNKAEMEVPEEVTDQMADFSSLTTAKDAMEEYKSLLEQYSENIKNGDVDAATELKTKLDELKSYAEGKFNFDEIKALGDLTSLADQIQSGKVVDLNKAFDVYNQSMKALDNIPMDAETREAMDASKDAMQSIQGLGGL